MFLTAIVLASLLIGYLVGSIPFGYIVGKMHGIDLTAEGSGSTGTTNALRLLGKKAAFAVLAGDFGKGVLASYVAFWLIKAIPALGETALSFQALIFVLASLACLIGHSKSIWIGFKGGKSVAAGVGTLVALDWRVGLITALIWATIVFTSKFSSLGALIAVPLSPLTMYLVKTFLERQNSQSSSIWLYVGYCTLGAVYIIYKHKANIQRLLDGTEPKIGQSQKSA